MDSECMTLSNVAVQRSYEAMKVAQQFNVETVAHQATWVVHLDHAKRNIHFHADWMGLVAVGRKNDVGVFLDGECKPV